MADADHIRFHGEARVKWQDAVKEWATTAGEHVKAGTLTRYLCSLKQVRPFLDDVLIHDIDRKKVAQIARRSGVTNATRRRDLTAVSVVLAWCVSQGWRNDNPAKDWDRSAIRERRDPIMLPSEADIDRVVSEAPGRFANLIRMAQYTGMREEEVASLERRQVNIKRRAIDLSKTKTGRPRSVPMDERAIGTFSGTVAHLQSAYVFWHDDGARYMNVASRFAMISKRTEARAKAAGVSFRRFRFHDLRHWFAVDYLRRGGSIYDLQKVLGHGSIKTTEIYLSYLTPDEQASTKDGTCITV